MHNNRYTCRKVPTLGAVPLRKRNRTRTDSSPQVDLRSLWETKGNLSISLSPISTRRRTWCSHLMNQASKLRGRYFINRSNKKRHFTLKGLRKKHQEEGS